MWVDEDRWFPVADNVLKEACEKAHSTFPPLASRVLVFLFGSRVSGNTWKGDVDIFVWFEGIQDIHSVYDFIFELEALVFLATSRKVDVVVADDKDFFSPSVRIREKVEKEGRLVWERNCGTGKAEKGTYKPAG